MICLRIVLHIHPCGYRVQQDQHRFRIAAVQEREIGFPGQHATDRIVELLMAEQLFR